MAKINHLKFILFTYEAYEANGGMRDFEGSFDTVEEAEDRFTKDGTSHGEIVDRDTWEEIKSLVSPAYASCSTKTAS